MSLKSTTILVEGRAENCKGRLSRVQYSSPIRKPVGKLRQGPLCEKRKHCELTYWQLHREVEKREKLSYTNQFHKGLLNKDV